jgi:hypothetical protein
MPAKKQAAKRAGRPCGTPEKLTPEVVKGICDALELSVPIELAAPAHGVADRTFRDWMAKGEQGVEPYAEFHAAVTRARAKAACNLTARALSGGPGAAQAAWFLERRFREYYGTHLMVGGVAGSPIQIDSELRAAAALRGNPAVADKLHDAIAEAIASTSSSNGKASANGHS